MQKCHNILYSDALRFFIFHFFSFCKCSDLFVDLTFWIHCCIIQTFHQTVICCSPCRPLIFFVSSGYKIWHQRHDIRLWKQCFLPVIFPVPAALLKFGNTDFHRKISKICIWILITETLFQQLVDLFIIDSVTVPFFQKFFLHLRIRLPQNFTLNQFCHGHFVYCKMRIFLLADHSRSLCDSIFMKQFLHCRMPCKRRQNIRPVSSCLSAHGHRKKRFFMIHINT